MSLGEVRSIKIRSKKKAHPKSGECSGRVPPWSLSWAAQTSVAESVHPVHRRALQHKTTTCRVPGGPWQWLQRAAAGATCSTGRCGRAVPVAAHTSKQKHARTRTHAGTHACVRASTDACSLTKALHTRTRTLKRTHTRTHSHTHTHSQGTITLTTDKHTRTHQRTDTETHTHTHNHTHTHTITRTSARTRAHIRRERMRPLAYMRGLAR